MKIPKLPYGEGSMSLYEGEIFYKKQITLPDGSKKRIAVRGKTPQICLQKMREKEEELKSTTPQTKEILLDAMLLWADTIKMPTLKKQSYTRLISTINNQIGKYDIGHSRYQSITTEDIQTHINLLNKKELSHSTIKKTYDALNDFYRYASIRHKFDNPMLLVVMPVIDNIKKETREIVWFEESDINKFIAESTAKWRTGRVKYVGGYIYAANIFLGLRIGELLALQWQDIDFDKRSLYVCKTLIEENNPDYDENDPKSKKVRFTIQPTVKTSHNRYVPINTKAMELIEEHKKLCQFTEPKDYVISTRNRKTTTAKNADDTIKAIQRNAETDVQGASTHCLRHTCASLLYKKGVPSELIAKILGNSVEVLRKTYLHFEEQQLYNAVDSITRQLIE